MTENGISSSHPKVIPDGIPLVFSLIELCTCKNFMRMSLVMVQ